MSTLKPMCPQDIIPSRFLGQIIETVGFSLKGLKYDMEVYIKYLKIFLCTFFTSCSFCGCSTEMFVYGV